MATYSSVPTVPENTLDPAAGLNQALYVLGTVANAVVLSMDDTSPPGSPDEDGDLRLVASAGATGAWTGKEDHLARYVAAGSVWDFFTPELVKIVVNMEDGKSYYYDTQLSPGQWTQVYGT